MDNLRADTLFPMPENASRMAFKLNMGLQGNNRELLIDKSVDQGKSWNPAFKIRYVKLAETASVASLDRLLQDWLAAYQDFKLGSFVDLYADEVVFHDPTAGVKLTSKQQVKSFFSPIMNNRYGSNFKFELEHKAFSTNSIALTGRFSLTYNSIVVTMPFSTWLTIENGKIIKQLDMFDYATMNKTLGEALKSPPAEFKG